MTRNTLIRAALVSAAAIAIPAGVSAQETTTAPAPQTQTPTAETAAPATSNSASRIPSTTAEDPAATATDPAQDSTATTPPVADTSQDPATTDATAGAQASTGASASAGAVTAATTADVTAGAEVRDQNGQMVGKIESVDASGAVLATGASRVQIPVNSFGKNGQGLVIAMTKAQLDAAAKAQSPS